VVENRRFGDYQGGPGGPGSILQIRCRTFAREGNDREVLGAGILFEASKGGTDVIARGFQIGQDQHGLGLFRAFHKPLRVGYHLDPVTQVLQPVDDLTARQQLLIEHKREGLHHAGNLEEVVADCKRIRSNGRKSAIPGLLLLIPQRTQIRA